MATFMIYVAPAASNLTNGETDKINHTFDATWSVARSTSAYTVEWADALRSLCSKEACVGMESRGTSDKPAKVMQTTMRGRFGFENRHGCGVLSHWHVLV